MEQMYSHQNTEKYQYGAYQDTPLKVSKGNTSHGFERRNNQGSKTKLSNQKQKTFVSGGSSRENSIRRYQTPKINKDLVHIESFHSN